MLTARPSKFSSFRSFDAFGVASFTIGAKQTNTINVAGLLKDARGQTVTGACVAKVYLSDNADGSTLTATVPTSNLAIGTKGIILGTLTTNKCVEILTDSSGHFDINIVQTASPVTYYMVVVLPDGSITISLAITF